MYKNLKPKLVSLADSNGKYHKGVAINVLDLYKSLPEEFWKASLPRWTKKSNSNHGFLPQWLETVLKIPTENYEASLENLPKDIHSELSQLKAIFLPFSFDRYQQREFDFHLWLVQEPEHMFCYFNFKKPFQFNGKTYVDLIGKVQDFEKNELEQLIEVQRIGSRYSIRYDSSILMEYWNSKREEVRETYRDFFRERREIVKTKAMMDLCPDIILIKEQFEAAIKSAQQGHLTAQEVIALNKKIEQFIKISSHYLPELN